MPRLRGNRWRDWTAVVILMRGAEFITLDTWKALSEADRIAALSKAGGKSLNRQDNKSIGWANYSWDPVSGCLHNCPYCYARDIPARFYPQGFEPSLYPDRLNTPIKAKPRVSDDPADAVNEVQRSW